MQSLVAVKLMHQDSSQNWDEIPVAGYLPVFNATDALLQDNIEKRLQQLYFDADPTIIKIRWKVKGTDLEYTLTKSA